MLKLYVQVALLLAMFLASASTSAVDLALALPLSSGLKVGKVFNGANWRQLCFAARIMRCPGRDGVCCVTPLLSEQMLGLGLGLADNTKNEERGTRPISGPYGLKRDEG